MSGITPEKFKDIMKAKQHWLLVGSQRAERAFGLAQYYLKTGKWPHTSFEVAFVNAVSHNRGRILIIMLDKAAVDVARVNLIIQLIMPGEDYSVSEGQDIAVFPGDDSELELIVDFVAGIASGAKVFSGPMGDN